MSLSRTKHAPYFILLDSFDQKGCPICNLVVQAVERYFDRLVYERVNDVQVRENLRAALGYCAIHGEYLRQAQSASGAAILYRDLLNTLIKRIPNHHAGAKSGSRKWLSDIFSGPRDASIPKSHITCPACGLARENEVLYLDTLIKYWTEPDLQTVFRKSAGLCLPHFRLLFERSWNDKNIHHIQGAQLDIWRHLLGELDTFIRKQDYRFSHEPMGSEADSWSRAIDAVSGIWKLAGRDME